MELGAPWGGGYSPVQSQNLAPSKKVQVKWEALPRGYMGPHLTLITENYHLKDTSSGTRKHVAQTSRLSPQLGLVVWGLLHAYCFTDVIGRGSLKNPGDPANNKSQPTRFGPCPKSPAHPWSIALTQTTSAFCYIRYPDPTYHTNRPGYRHLDKTANMYNVHPVSCVYNSVNVG